MTNRRVQVAGRGVYGRVVPLKPPKRQGIQLPRLSQKAWRAIGLVVIVLVIVWGLSGIFAVTQITVSAPENASRIEAETRDLLGRQFWQANVLLLDTNNLEAKLKAADPTIKSVEISRSLPHTLRLTVELKQPSIAWMSADQTFVLDADGTAIGGVSADAKLPVVTDGSNLPVKVGDRVVSRRFVSFVQALVPAVAARGIGITKLSVGDTTYDLTAETNKNFRLVFDTGREVSDAMIDLDAVLKLLNAQKKAPAEYIDLRIAGKAYYK